MPYQTMLLLGLTILVILAGPVSCRDTAAKLLSTDFETDPVQLGWSLGAHGEREADGEWIDTVSASGRHALVARTGWWASPRLKLTPQSYYRLRFSAMVEGKAYWMVQFYDAAGKPMASDHYASIYPCDEWRAYELCFRARHQAATGEVRFQAINAPLFVDNVTVEAVPRGEAAEWADRMYAEIPPVDLKAVPRPGKRLHRSMQKLRDGKTLRVVMLGDSIINDIGNSAWDVLVERMYPGASVELILSVGGGKGCRFYRAENRVKPHVLDHKPDLLIIGGISNDHDGEHIRDVIRQVRAESDPEILVMSGAVVTKADLRAFIAKLPKARQREILERARNYRPALAAMAMVERVEYFDLRAHWDAYVSRIRKHPEWFRRDRPHCNTRGHMVLARLLATYFSPAGAR